MVNSNEKHVKGMDTATPKVCIIGAGFSGICAAVKLKKKLNLKSFTIFDGNSDFGGTWLINTYPGCACDVTSHLYSFSFEPNPNWSQSYAPQPEILAYLKGIAQKYGLHSHAKFKCIINRVTWDERLLQWRVFCLDKESGIESEILFDIVINAQGRFQSPNIPKEFSAFQGPVLHSARWNDSVKISGKNVAVVGSGASAAQIIPAIAEKVEQLFVYQRRAPWVVPRTQYKFSDPVKWIFSYIPGLRWIFRCYLYWLYEINFPCFRLNTLRSKIAPFLAKLHLKKQVKNLKTREGLTPGYQFGCKRVIPTSEYYPTFNLPNVRLITSKIETVTKDTIITADGKDEKQDVIILATGFVVHDHFASFKLQGKNGVDIYKTWVNEKPRSYLGIVTADAPNFFTLLGPNTATGYTSVIFGLECQVNWIVKAIKKMKKRNIKCLTVKSSIEDSYMNEIHKKMKNTIYGSGNCGQCGSWYLNSKGSVVEIYPDTTYSYWRRTRKVRLSEFEIDYAIVQKTKFIYDD